MNFTNFRYGDERLKKIFLDATKEIESSNNFKFPIIDKTNPKYSIDFSSKLPSDDNFMYTKLNFKVVFDNIIDLDIDVGKVINVNVRVGEDLVKSGFFVKDLFISLVGNDSFTYNNFLTALSPSDSIFVSYGISFLKAGIIVYIPREFRDVKVNVKKRLNSSFAGSFYNMFYVGDNTNVNLYEDIISDLSDSKTFFEISEIIVGKGSNLVYNIFQNIDISSEYFTTRKLKTLGDNNIEVNDVSLGAIYQRIDDRIFMENQNVETKYTGIYFTKGDQKYDILVNARHRGFNQGADIIVKGVLDDRSKVYFNGVLKVEKNLKNINSFLGGHSLHLSSNCKSDSIPSLEIDSFDVKSGHAASLTQLDEEKLFYMMSRGLSQEDAKKAIVQGFIEGALRRITDDGFRFKVKKHLVEKGIDVIEVLE
ncbi:MAG: SufD family Fe-S cluster assembly protein [Brevinematia bacterium]